MKTPTNQPKAKHTPAPWTRPENKGTLIYAADYHTGQTGYITSVNFCKDVETTNANARLIAATPELLQALEKIVEIMNHDMPYISSGSTAEKVMLTARAAIKKATT